ncbi:hypothetical protein NA57DRAFT_78025 [Rhizodiscina lignyota]|uniref:Centromere protein Q n=1 Tax=Rhizodiscina lignyota TaxID=1504668 RepID=A0A9P4I9C0_9PEZI|nr:hypothetical protein NA57DRAFT_78025 [Rhizodiscina lignyota]
MAPSTSARRRVPDTNSEAQPTSRKRKSDGAPNEASSRPHKRFQYLKPRTRRISQNLITSKWTPLPAPAQQQVRELFKAAKRPVILARHDERRKREAEVVLDHMVTRLEKQLPRMPFPPKSKEGDFDLDGLVEKNRMLENLVTPAIHSIELLKAEIEKEEAALQRDRETLRRLERDSQAEQRAAESSVTTIHPLLESGLDSETIANDAESINMQKADEASSIPLEDMDHELLPLIAQFRSHLESMQANAMQVDGLSEAISRTSAALNSAFYQRSGGRQYEAIFDVS